MNIYIPRRLGLYSVIKPSLYYIQPKLDKITKFYMKEKCHPCCEAGSESYGSLMLSLGSRGEDCQVA
jgi:hypothetical protein